MRLRHYFAASALAFGVVACDPIPEPLPDTTSWQRIELSGDCDQALGLVPGNYEITMSPGTADCPRINVTGSPTDVVVRNVTVRVDDPPTEGLNSAVVDTNRAFKFTGWTGTFILHNAQIYGPYLYEGANVRGGSPESVMVWQFVDFNDPVLAVKTGTGGSHKGGDVLQTDGGTLAELRIHGLYAQVTYQGIFLQYGPSRALLDGVELHHPTWDEWSAFMAATPPPAGLAWNLDGDTPLVGEHYWPGSCKIDTNSPNGSINLVDFDPDDVVIDWHQSLNKPWNELAPDAPKLETEWACDIDEATTGNVLASFPTES